MGALRAVLIAAAAFAVAAAPEPAAAQVTAAEAIAAAARTPEVRAERRERARTYIRAWPEDGRWTVALFDRDRDAVALVYVDDRTGEVLEAWTGVQVEWTMARGYPGAFGRAVNNPWVWVALSLLFVLPFLRGPPRMVHLDVAVLLAFGLSYAAFGAAEIGISVPTVYPLLVYLLARMLWLARRAPAPPLRLIEPPLVLFAALVGARIALTLLGNVIDVGAASVAGADRLVGGEPLYRPGDRGDTYGPVVYAAYVPFELLLSPRAAAHAAALAFDLGCLALLWRIGGRTAAYLWAAYPFAALVAASSANDALVALLVLAAVASRSGVVTALAGLTKLAPLALAPLLLGRRTLAWAAFALTLAALIVPLDPGAFLDRTAGFQAERDSPFSIWGDRDGLQLAAQLGAVAIALFVPRRNVVAAAAAVLIAVQIGADHWFYSYLVWFAPLVWLAGLSTGSMVSASRPEARTSTALSHGSSSAAS